MCDFLKSAQNVYARVVLTQNNNYARWRHCMSFARRLGCDEKRTITSFFEVDSSSSDLVLLCDSASGLNIKLSKSRSCAACAAQLYRHNLFVSEPALVFKCQARPQAQLLIFPDIFFRSSLPLITVTRSDVRVPAPFNCLIVERFYQQEQAIYTVAIYDYSPDIGL